ncbi:MAG: hypothetical protein MUF38_14325 [Anaerolineae bacterium]|jgi:hypothetical protein|nr:hypothetical protein [Anaerolineae bacterium]
MSKDLILLVADLDAEQTLKTLLEQRTKSLGISRLNYEILRHPQRDAGCYGTSHEVLRPYTGKYKRALVVFDHHGSGHDNERPDVVEAAVERQLLLNGWEADNVRAIVIQPELEAWIWSRSPHLGKVIGWPDTETLREWVKTQTVYWSGDTPKPEQPKEALEAALRHKKKQPSPARLFSELAEKMSLKGCIDRSYNRLVGTLQGWFPA